MPKTCENCGELTENTHITEYPYGPPRINCAECCTTCDDCYDGDDDYHTAQAGDQEWIYLNIK